MCVHVVQGRRVVCAAGWYVLLLLPLLLLRLMQICPDQPRPLVSAAEVPRGMAQGMGPAASYLLLAICIRSAEGRRRVVSELVRTLSGAEADGGAAPSKRGAGGGGAAAPPPAAGPAAEDMPFLSKPGGPPPFKVGLAGCGGAPTERGLPFQQAGRQGSGAAFCCAVVPHRLPPVMAPRPPARAACLPPPPCVRQIKAFVDLAASLLSTTGGRGGQGASQQQQQQAVSTEIVRAMKDAGKRAREAVAREGGGVPNEGPEGCKGCVRASKRSSSCGGKRSGG